jgi:hypothetical protein
MKKKKKISKTILLITLGRAAEPPYLANQLTKQSRNLVNHPTQKPPPRNTQYRETTTSTANPLAILPTLPFTNTENPLPYCTTVHRCLGCYGIQ